MRTIPLSDVRPTTVEWLWPGRIPFGSITIVDGDPDVGKSTIMCDLAARVTRGRSMPLCDHVTAAGDVLILDYENDVSNALAPKLVAAGADPNRVKIATIEDLPDSPEDTVKELVEKIRRRRPRLVIIDPLRDLLGRNMQTEHAVRRLLAPLAAVARETQSAIAGLRHLTKSASGRALARGTGSIGLAAVARSMLVARELDGC